MGDFEISFYEKDDDDEDIYVDDDGNDGGDGEDDDDDDNGEVSDNEGEDYLPLLLPWPTWSWPKAKKPSSPQ